MLNVAVSVISVIRSIIVETIALYIFRALQCTFLRGCDTSNGPRSSNNFFTIWCWASTIPAAFTLAGFLSKHIRFISLTYSELAYLKLMVMYHRTSSKKQHHHVLPRQETHSAPHCLFSLSSSVQHQLEPHLPACSTQPPTHFVPWTGLHLLLPASDNFFSCQIPVQTYGNLFVTLESTIWKFHRWLLVTQNFPTSQF